MGISQCLVLAAAVTAEPSTGIVVAAGISIVFSILVLLYLLISLEGVIFASLDGKKKKAPAAQAVAPVASPLMAMVAPVIETGIPAEVVAAISAAVASMEGGKYTIRSMTRAKQGRSAWGGAGVASYTEPF